MLRVKPRKLLVRVKRCLPDKAAVGLVFHAEQRKVETGEVVVVNAAVDKGCRKSDLTNVLLDSEFGCPHGKRSPLVAKYRMIRHAYNLCLVVCWEAHGGVLCSLE